MKLFPTCFPTDLIYRLDHKLNFKFYRFLFIQIPLICIFMCAFYCLTIFFCLNIFYNTFKHWLVPFPPIVLFLWNFLSFLFCLFSLLAAAAAAKSLQSCLTLWDLIDRSPPGSPVPGILQARTLEWGCHVLLQCMKVKSESEITQSCLTLRNPIDCSPSGSSLRGIFQARVLEWGAIAFSVSMLILLQIFSYKEILSFFF